LQLPDVKAQRRGDYALNDSITITINAFGARRRFSLTQAALLTMITLTHTYHPLR
jgi:hypothetical protein